jgi:hypothetical protein
MLPNTWKKSTWALCAMCRQIVLITFIMFPIKYSVSNSLLEISPSICLVRPCSQLLIL